MKRSCMFCDGRGYQPVHRSWWEFWKPTREECWLCDGKGYRSSGERFFMSESLNDSEEQSEPNEFQWVWDAMYDAMLNQTQYTVSIGLDQPELTCFVADTVNLKCVYYYNTREFWERQFGFTYQPGSTTDDRFYLDHQEWQDEIASPPEHISNNRCCEPVERSFETVPADRDAVFKEAKEIVKPLSDECSVTDEELDAVLSNLAARPSKKLQLSSTRVTENCFFPKEMIDRVKRDYPVRQGEDSGRIDTAFMARGQAMSLRNYLTTYCGMQPDNLPAPPRELDGAYVVPGYIKECGTLRTEEE